MRRYETITILRPNLGEDEITAIIDRSNKIIEEFSGSVVRLERWGLKKLAYQIKKENQGYYVFTEYAGTPEAVDEMERLCRIDDKTLKYMTVKLQDVFEATEADTTAADDEESAEAAEESTETTEEPTETAAKATESTEE